MKFEVISVSDYAKAVIKNAENQPIAYINRVFFLKVTR